MAVRQDEKLKRLVTARQNQLERDKSNFEDRLQDVADYVCPHRDDIRDVLNKGEKKGRKIYDGTAVSAAVLATDGIHGYHISPAFPWFKYVMSNKQANKIPEVREWLEVVEHNMYMALNRSNFYSEMWSYIYDGFTLGTAPMAIQEDVGEGRIMFEAVHPGESYIAENKFGEVDLHHRKRKVSVRKLVQMFGKDLPQEVQDMAERHPFKELELIHACFPREEYDDRKLDVMNKKYASVWILTGYQNHICRISGFDRFPYRGTWRYLRTGKEPYGVSPSHLAMADIKGVNLIDKSLLGAGQMAVDPAYNVPAYLQGHVQLRPRGFNYMKNQGDQITPINTGQGSFPIGRDIREDKRDAIRSRFHVDTFLMLSQINQGTGQRTAYEVSEMMAEKAAVLGAELGPLDTAVDYILEEVFDIETAAGRIPAPPPVLAQMAEVDPTMRFDPEFQGPLAQAQREKFGKTPLRKFVAELAGLAELDPDVLDEFDLSKAARLLADANGVPEEVKRDPTIVARIRAAKAAAAQQQQMAEEMGQGVDMMKTAAEADKASGGAIMNALGEQVGGVQ